MEGTVCIAGRLQLNGPGVESLQRYGNFSSAISPIRLWSTSILLFKEYQQFWDKPGGCGFDHSHLSRDKDKNEWSYTSPPHCVCMTFYFPGVTTHCGCIFHSPVAGFSLLVFEVS
jgi:hypothetical protein